MQTACEHEMEHDDPNDCKRHDLEDAVTVAANALDPFLLRAENGELSAEEKVAYAQASAQYDAARAALNVHDGLPAQARL